MLNFALAAEDYVHFVKRVAAVLLDAMAERGWGWAKDREEREEGARRRTGKAGGECGGSVHGCLLVGENGMCRAWGTEGSCSSR